MRTLITTGVGTPRRCNPWTFVTNCHPIVEKLAASVKDHEVSSIAFATSVLRGLQRTLEELTGAGDAMEVGPAV